MMHNPSQSGGTSPGVHGGSQRDRVGQAHRRGAGYAIAHSQRAKCGERGPQHPPGGGAVTLPRFLRQGDSSSTTSGAGRRRDAAASNRSSRHSLPDEEQPVYSLNAQEFPVREVGYPAIKRSADAGASGFSRGGLSWPHVAPRHTILLAMMSVQHRSYYTATVTVVSVRVTGRYSVSRSNGMRPASVISRIKSWRRSICGVVAPASW